MSPLLGADHLLTIFGAIVGWELGRAIVHFCSHYVIRIEKKRDREAF
jgi:hypothetical protein